MRRPSALSLTIVGTAVVLAADTAPRLTYELRAYQVPTGTLRLKVWPEADGGSPREFELETLSRFITHLEWLDSRNVLAAGDGHALIMDTLLAGATHRFWYRLVGEQPFSVSPDRKLILYTRGVPRGIPLGRHSDVALLVAVGNGVRPSRQHTGLESGATEFYPPTSGSATPHRFLSGFLWFSDSTRALFVEHHEGVPWMVLLNLAAPPSGRAERFRLPADSAPVHEFAWVTPDYDLRLTIGSTRLLVKPLQHSAERQNPD